MTRPEYLLKVYFPSGHAEVSIYSSINKAVEQQIGSGNQYGWLLEVNLNQHGRFYSFERTEDFIEVWKRTEREKLEAEWRFSRIDWSLEEHLSKAEGPVIRKPSVRAKFASSIFSSHQIAAE